MRQILGESLPIKNLISMIHKVSGNKTNILVIGDSGTGKELVARMIHESGPMKGKAFIPVNCGAIPETLIESEMFGHKKGSFTGAISDKIGLFEAGSGGTLFLDEVGELPLSMQVKMLRALQEKTIRRVGANEDIKVDVRIIAATNRDLEAGVKAGTFREDLYYRLNVILIKTPSLRERHGDVEILANAFLKKFAERQKKELDGFSDEVLEIFRTHHWPGNVRELENTVERAVTLETGRIINVGVLPPAVVVNYDGGARSKLESLSINVGQQKLAAISPGPPGQGSSKEIRLPLPDFKDGPMNLDEVLAEVEKQYLKHALSFTGGVKKKAADLLGMTFRSIRYRLGKLGMEVVEVDQDDTKPSS
ncbi:MAG: sigma-54-dependent Fis family transcriptional regulator [Cryobacterium sp.]|nr:sigma-54-dependent Fis family transcriptional regulator [Oligoflexia bacterium]